MADTGIGMSTETREKIFEPFFSTKGIGGAGLGLWISCEIVNHNYGNLRLKSRQSDGRSGRVSLFLPSPDQRYTAPEIGLMNSDDVGSPIAAQPISVPERL